MEHDHLERRVSRRRLIGGIGTLGIGGLGGIAAIGALLPAHGARTSPAEPAGFAADAALFAGAPTCALSPEATQGPYYFDAGKLRGDIREGRPGVRLRLALKVQEARTCRPLPDAVVDIWQCDAIGVYSGAEAQSKADHDSPPSFADISDKTVMPDLKPADSTRYLRGAQVAGADGVVRFTTIWPGWYPGRTVHVHVLVLVDEKRVLSTQLMFDEALNKKVMAREPYAGHTGRDTFNHTDPVFTDGMLMKVVEDGDGYLGTMVLSAGR
ncbi:MAG TPA: hypothetical protein VFV66_20605 [Nonomuraea sp.]|nr:hypothetical protein [Nonomuraea sp.]